MPKEYDGCQAMLFNFYLRVIQLEITGLKLVIQNGINQKYSLIQITKPFKKSKF